MPSSPKILKESMIQAALELLIEKGNAGVTIKTVAARLGCSTQPISRQFGGMDGLRKELAAAAERYAYEKYYNMTENASAAFEKTGWGAIDLAINEPNLFRFLYMGESGHKAEGGFLSFPKSADAGTIRRRLAELLRITPQEAERFMTTMILYTQGVAAMIAANIVRDDRRTIHRMVRETGFLFLKGLGVAPELIDALLHKSYRELIEGAYLTQLQKGT